MPLGTSTARETLDRALSTTTIRRRLLMPPDIADQLLEPDDEVLLALPGIPDDKPGIVVVTTREVLLGRWNAVGYEGKDVTRKRAVPARDIRGAGYIPGLHYNVEIDVHSARGLSLEPCTAEDGIRFTHALRTLAATGRVPPPMPPDAVITARHAEGTYSPDSTENRMRAAWDRALLATKALWNCTAIHSGPALGWLQPGEHTLLVLVGSTGVSNEYLAVTDRRIFRGRGPGSPSKERRPAQVREARFDGGFFTDSVRVEMHDGSSLKIGSVSATEGREFVEALNTLVTTGSLPAGLQPFR